MTLSEIQTELLSKTKRLEICDILHDAITASTEIDMINAGISMLVWAYQSGIVDDDLLSEFNESNLNAAGIYTIGTHTFTNPTTDIFILKNAVANFILSDNSKFKIVGMGSSTITIDSSNKAYAQLNFYDNCQVLINQLDESMINLECKQFVTLNHNLFDGSIFHAKVMGDSIINLVLNESSFALLDMFSKSTLNYTLNDSAEIDPIPHNSAVINIIGT